MKLSVIIPAHNPHPERLRRTLLGLRAQTLPTDQWETLLVDNASTPFPSASALAESAPAANFSVLREPRLGLAYARLTGFAAARGEYAILVDDDNVLAPDYLARVLAFFERHPRVGAVGGRSLPEFASDPEPWQREFFPLLALRDLGDDEIISAGLAATDSARNHYPDYAPIGAGMALRRAAWETWTAARSGTPALTDRRGGELTSGGDNDIVLTLMRAGWEVAYDPALSLTHLIPAGRLDPDYLARLNRGIQKSWMQVLTLHAANPWSPLSPLSARLRRLKAFFSYHAWRSPASHIRWQGACGHFDGRVVRS